LPSYLALITTFTFTLLVLLALKPIAIKVGLMDHPGGRKDHTSATPLIGGIAIYLGTLAVTLFIPDLLNHYSPLLAISALVLIVGIVDDYKDLSISIRLGTQVFATALMILLAGIQLFSVGNILFIGTIMLGNLGLPITIFATVGVINAVNMSDGIDGLCGGMILITLTFLGIMNYQQSNLIQAGFITVLICTLLAYLTLNFRPIWRRPALVYLGDAGSTFMGFVLAWLLIESSQGSTASMPAVLALWFMAMPIMDTVALMIKRPLEGRSPFHAGRDHLHHRLLDCGLSSRRVVGILYGMEIIFGVAGLTAYNLGVSEGSLFIVFLLLFTAYLKFVRYSK
jgi:UDP-GlcNAc:undecaprenyl-phosphate/decaprenyl-phosphate GlcNAc-1-phosphate transferase